jgi:hypothetical protein
MKMPNEAKVILVNNPKASEIPSAKDANVWIAPKKKIRWPSHNGKELPKYLYLTEGITFSSRGDETNRSVMEAASTKASIEFENEWH